ncbi:MAG TPA: diguanylate cyclase [Burkholderiales bacterium]|nr:diguanylate cyclase [Burkholderiales bacterium]
MKLRISDPRFQLFLRTRFALSLGAVLLPFLVAAAVGQFYLLPRLIKPLDDIVYELTEETVPVVHLQMALLQAAMPVNDYLINGDPGERRQFAQLRQKVERAFDATPPERFLMAQERASIEFARTEWTQALPLGEQLLRLPDPVANAAAARGMKRFDAHIDRAVSALDEAHDLPRVIDQSRTRAGTARTRALWTTYAAFVLAAMVSLFAGATLARPLLAGLGAIDKATALLAAGDLSARAVLDGTDELGQLALAFNTMAEKLEKNEAALRELATHDGLTALYNHHTFYVLLGDELARAQRFNRPLSLLLLDIDHFKRVNDTHGHQAGDAVLKGLSELLGREARAIDRVCRYGGEEFTVILPETDLEAAALIAERLRASVEAQPFDVEAGAPLRITVSIGVASWPLQGEGVDTLVAAADTALYAAKRSGRNRISRHVPVSHG